LFGFVGAFFAAVAVAPDEKSAVQGSLCVFYLAINLKSLILVFSGLSSMLFFSSALLALYAKMFSIKSTPSNDDEELVAAHCQINRLRLLKYSACAFNAGAVLAPIAGFLVMPATAFWIVLFIYILSLGVGTRWVVRI